MKVPPAFRDWLRTRFGFNEEVYQGSSFQSAVRTRMRALGVNHEQDYWPILLASKEECQALTELLFVPESWFFRDRTPFFWFEQWLREVWLPGPATRGQILRILSVPCATGQEPYSIAMVLKDAGLDPKLFHLEAGDVSMRFIEQAKAGVYRNLSFRGKDAEGREHHFEKLDAQTFKVRDEIREQVHFRQINLMELGLLQPSIPYHVIFCRNALIYFTKDARKQVMDGLLSLMDKKGLLFCGHADSVLSITDKLEPVGPPGAFCYRLRVAVPRLNPLPPAPVREREPRKAIRRERAVPKTPEEDSMVGKPEENFDWEAIRELANKGILDEAEARCREQLARFPVAAEGWFLLGLVKMAEKKPDEAETFFKKAVYLKKDHVEALFQLALICDRRGEVQAAERYRQRARRAGKLFEGPER